MTAPAPFAVSFHDEVSGTAEQDFVLGAPARDLFEKLKTWPTITDAQLWCDGQMIEEWKRP